MYHRFIESVALDHINKRRCLTLIGPRQSGKTTLCKKPFPQYDYNSFESPDIRDLFNFDPRGFLLDIKKSSIFYEVQKVSELLSYLQEILDNSNDMRKFVLTGSNSLQLSDKVSQTLAGRAGQVVSFNSLAGDSGITQPTVKRWISALELLLYVLFCSRILRISTNA